MDIMRVHLRRHQDQKNIIPNVLPLPTASTSVPDSVQPSTVTTNTNIQQQPTTSGRIVCQPCVGQPTPPHVQQVVQQAMQQHQQQQQQDLQQQQQQQQQQ